MNYEINLCISWSKMDSIKPGELLVGGSNLFIRGGPGDVKKVVELIIHRFAILLKTKK